MCNKSQDSNNGYNLKSFENGQKNYSIKFTIPLYQRLFEWEEDQVAKFLDSLLNAFSHNKDMNYYIGMFTVFPKSQFEFELVDGQQRFTVITLLSLYLGFKDVCYKEDEGRLVFSARKEDQDFIDKLLTAAFNNKVGLKDCIDRDINEYLNIITAPHKNRKMMEAIKVIHNFFKKNSEVGFVDYIKEKLIFFISELPQTYTTADLIKHFELMNSEGRSLEQYEIIKVKILKKIESELNENSDKNQNSEENLYINYCECLWNDIADMDRNLIRPTYNNNQEESRESIVERFINSVDSVLHRNSIKFDSLKINDSKLKSVGKTESEKINEESKGDEKSIKDLINLNMNIPKEPDLPALYTSDNALMSFPLFLLMVLYHTLPEEQKKNTNISLFFDVNMLDRTFNQYLFDNKDNTVSKFLTDLLKYRLFLDAYFIKYNNNESVDDYKMTEWIFNGSDDKKECLEKYQAMLFVASSGQTIYSWIDPALTFIDEKAQNGAHFIEQFTAEDLLDQLKFIDNERHKRELLDDSKNFRYGSVDRYWFWRLDYYIWLNRKELFKDNQKALDIAKNYKFRRNRSIEHLIPQHPKTNSNVIWSEDNLESKDSFGNLVMISSGQNSSLQNESIEVKSAKVESYINGNITGTIESLKMLYFYVTCEKSKDYIKNIEDFTKWSIEQLEKSYPKNN